MVLLLENLLLSSWSVPQLNFFRRHSVLMARVGDLPSTSFNFFKLKRSIPYLNDTSRFTVRLYLFWSPNFVGDFVAQLKLECFDFLLSIATWNLEILIFLMGLNNFCWIVCGLCCTHKKKFILFLKNFYIFGGTVKTARKFIFIFFYVGFDFL